MTYSRSFQEIEMADLLLIDGGKWSWKGFVKSIVGGATGGAVGGAVAGGGAGALPGAGVGAVGGALTYLVTGWW